MKRINHDLFRERVNEVDKDIFQKENTNKSLFFPKKAFQKWSKEINNQREKIIFQLFENSSFVKKITDKPEKGLGYKINYNDNGTYEVKPVSQNPSTHEDINEVNGFACIGNIKDIQDVINSNPIINDNTSAYIYSTNLIDNPEKEREVLEAILDKVNNSVQTELYPQIKKWGDYDINLLIKAEYEEFYTATHNNLDGFDKWYEDKIIEQKKEIFNIFKKSTNISFFDNKPNTNADSFILILNKNNTFTLRSCNFKESKYLTSDGFTCEGYTSNIMDVLQKIIDRSPGLKEIQDSNDNYLRNRSGRFIYSSDFKDMNQINSPLIDLYKNQHIQIQNPKKITKTKKVDKSIQKPKSITKTTPKGISM